MSSADGAAMAGVGIGVLMVVIGETAGGMAMMLLGVLGYILLSIGDEERDRGQLGPTPLWGAAIVLVALSIFVASDIITHSIGEFKAAEQSHVVCNGLFQCGPPGKELLAVIAIVLVLAVGLYTIRWWRSSTEVG